jgi:hypothetical protein
MAATACCRCGSTALSLLNRLLYALTIASNVCFLLPYMYCCCRVLLLQTPQLVVLLVSDIGATAIRSEILPYARREDVPPRVLMGAVKHALDRQWANLRFGKVHY